MVSATNIFFNDNSQFVNKTLNGFTLCCHWLKNTYDRDVKTQDEGEGDHIQIPVAETHHLLKHTVHNTENTEARKNSKPRLLIKLQ